MHDRSRVIYKIRSMYLGHWRASLAYDLVILSMSFDEQDHASAAPLHYSDLTRITSRVEGPPSSHPVHVA